MATRSRIGLKLTDGSILSVYHHYDGYPEWLGKTLVENYNSYDKVSELIDHGDMSSCWSDQVWGKKLPKGQFTVESYAMRGEDCPPRLDKNLFDYLDDGEEFAYVFDNGSWICYDRHEFDNEEPEVVSIPE
jgi:hypothetical protein